MSTSSSLKIGQMETLVVRKKVKNLHLSVLPPTGRVRVTAPEGMKDDIIRTLIATKLPWIKRQQAKFIGQSRQTKREFVSGESHYYFGKSYRLELVLKDVVPAVFIKGKSRIILQVRPNSLKAKREEVMTEWYRKELHSLVEKLIAKWQKAIGVRVNNWRIRKMKTRWGTCKHKDARILINLELAKKPIPCIEYVIVHELIHLLEKKHSQNFVNMITKYLPKWRNVKEELNRFTLSYEEWDY